jgi:hypothetical protein
MRSKCSPYAWRQEQANMPRTTAHTTHQKHAITIDHSFVRDRFTGAFREELLQLLTKYHIESIVLGGDHKHDAPISINFSKDVSEKPVTVARALRGKLELTRKGFRIKELIGAKIDVGLFGIKANIKGLNYNGSVLLVEHDAIVPSIPFPPGIPPTNIASTISHAFNIFRA